jgi:uncharacterized membrane protein (DUF2068 family)
MDKKAPLGLKLIAGAKIAKGVALAGISLGVFDSIHRDLAALAQRLVQAVGIAPENHYVILLLDKLGLVDRATLIRVGILSAVYASILLIEGLGLWFGAVWSEYMVLLSTGAFVPEECLALTHRFTWVRLGVLVLNGVVLAYMARVVWHRTLARRAAKAAARG